MAKKTQTEPGSRGISGPMVRLGDVMQGVTTDDDAPPPDARVINGLPGDDPDDPGLLVDVDETADEALAEVLSELGESDGSKIVIYRYDTEKKKEAYLFQCPPQGFNIDEIARRYGGGEFSIRVYRSPGNRLLTRKLLTIEEPRAATVSGAPVGDVGALITTAMREMQMQNQNNMMKMMELMMTRSQPSAPAQSISEMVQALAALKQLAPEPPKVANAMDDFKRMKEMVSMIADITPAASGDGDGVGARIFAKTFDKFLELWERSNSNLGGGSAPAPAPVIAAPVIEPGAPVEPMPSEEEMLKYYVEECCKKARENADVEPIAQIIAEGAPDSFIAKFVDNPDWFKYLCGISGEVASFPEWFKKLHDRVDVLTSEEVQDDNPGKS